MSDSSLTSEEIQQSLRIFINKTQNAIFTKDSISAPHRTPTVDASNRNVLVTSALPYVNNVPHLGNIVGCVLSADVFARFCRLRNYNTLYICGTDEYGTSTETKALEEGLTPRQICDKYHALHSQIYDWFGISFDHFGRTTTEEQTKVAQEIFWDLHKNDLLEENQVQQLYCQQNCKKFLADRFVEGTCPFCSFPDARGDQCDSCGKLINAIELKQPRCKTCSASPIVKSSKHIFLDLPKVEGRLSKWMDEASTNWSSNARSIAKTWVKQGLQSRCITRDLKWGTPVPLEGYTDKVFYVWYDAPIGYISITSRYLPTSWRSWWHNPDHVDHYEFMAKDNVPFHAVIFPSCLLGTGKDWTMVKYLMATEYLNYEDVKFSKSRGIGVFGNDAEQTGIESDVWRFYLIYTRPENQDSAFSWDDFVLKTNSELLANLGNFVNRALKFCKDSFNGKLASEMRLNAGDAEFVAMVAKNLEKYIDCMENCKERDGIIQILTITRLGNQYLQSNAPWKLVKTGSEASITRASSVVSLACNVAALVSVIVDPFMPNFGKELRRQLNLKPEMVPVLTPHFRCLLPPGHQIGEPSPIVKEIKPETVAELKIRFAGKQQKPEVAAAKPEVAKPEVVKPEVTKPEVTKPDAALAKELEKQVEAQGNHVRTLKESGADKDKLKPEVDKLLDLKKRLNVALGVKEEEKKGKKKGKKK